MQSSNLFAALIVTHFSTELWFLVRNLTTSSEQVKNVSLRYVYQILETLFDKLDSFGIKYKSEPKLIRILAVSDFESICFQEQTFRDTNKTPWLGKHVPISVSISSNLVEQPIFLCNSDPHHLVASFIGALENLASQSKTKMKNFFHNIELTIKVKLGNILQKFTLCHSWREHVRFDMSQDGCDNKNCDSTQFLQAQKSPLN